MSESAKQTTTASTTRRASGTYRKTESSMGTKEELDEHLTAFLRAEQEDREKGYTKESLHKALFALDGRFAEHERKDDARHDEVQRSVRLSHDELTRQIYALDGKFSGIEARVKIQENLGERLQSDFKGLRAKTDEVTREAFSSSHEHTEQELANARAALEERAREEAEANKRKSDRGWDVVKIVLGVVIAALFGAVLEHVLNGPQSAHHTLEAPGAVEP